MLQTFLSLVLCGLVSVAVADPLVHEFELSNGLKVLVREDHRAPVVVSQVWYKVGSSYEPSGLNGISHVLEHMMFDGTKNLAPGEFSRIVAAQGGQENAFTSRDYTAYYQKLVRDRLEISFKLEAERMRNLKLTKEEFAKEIRVVAEERRLRTDDQPESLTYEQFNAVAYLTSPYRNPVIGWMKDIQALKVDDLRRWYRQWYAPNNATVVVVGDLDPQAVKALAEKYFGPLEPGEQPSLKPAFEVAQHGERRVDVKAPAQLPYLIMGYKAPSMLTAEQDWEPYALEVLAGILDAGSSARLSRDLIRGAQVAASAGASYSMTSRLGELFVLAANPAAGHTVSEVEQALRAEVQKLRDESISAEELERVVAQVIAADVYQRDSIFYQAMRMGTLESIGVGWDALEDYVARIKQVSPKQVQEVARKYLIDDRLTVAILEPQPEDGVRPPAPAGSMGDVIR